MTHLNTSNSPTTTTPKGDNCLAQGSSTETFNKATAPHSGRLLSLDLLRGADLALLVLFQPIIYQWVEASEPTPGSFGEMVFGQITHVPWEGFCFWDIIMPLFMFMSGITIPFSMGKYQQGKVKADKGFLWRLLKRFVVLWVLGMIAQGNLLSFDPRLIHLYSNTLQSIAVGYVVVALLFVYTSWRTQLAVVAACLVGYVAVFAIWGQMDFTIDANICEEIDRQVLGHWRDGVLWKGDNWYWDDSYHYTWILSSLNFVVTVYLGCVAGMILRMKLQDLKKVRILLFSGVICLLLIALAYYWVDIKGKTKGIMWLRFYGANSLVAYMVGDHVDFSSITNSIFYGFQPLLGNYYDVLEAAVQGIIVLLILRWMYHSNIFIKA